MKGLYKILGWEGIAGMTMSVIPILVLLCANIRYVRPAPYKDLNECLEKSIIKERQNSREQIDIIEREMKSAGLYERVAPYYKRALSASDSAEKIMAHLEYIKWHLSQLATCDTDPFACLGDQSRKAVYKYLFEKNIIDSIDGCTKNIADFLLDQVEPNDRNILLPILPITYYSEHNNIRHAVKGWPPNQLRKLSPVNAICLISAIEYNISASLSIILTRIDEECHPIICRFDPTMIFAVPNRAYVVAGERVSADILWIIFNKAGQPTTSCNEGKINSSADGVIRWQNITSIPGKHVISGQYNIKTEDNTILSKEWSFEYMVSAPGASLQLDKMNTCYTGMSNPITVSAPGYPASALNLRAPGETVVKTAEGHFNIIISHTRPKGFYAFLDAKNEKGVVSTVGSVLLKVKELPAPVAAMYDDEIKVRQADSDLHMRYKVKSYELYILKRKTHTVAGPFAIKGAYYAGNPEADEAMRHIKAGDKLIADQIIATYEAGKEHMVNAVSMKVVHPSFRAIHGKINK